MDLPPKQGLYDPRNEHDACGVGFVANIKGHKTHDHHPPGAGDPHQPRSPRRGRRRPAAGRRRRQPDPDPRPRCSATGRSRARSRCRRRATTRWRCASCRRTPRRATSSSGSSRSSSPSEGQTLIGWRDVPTDHDGLGKAVLDSMPVIRQASSAAGPKLADQDAFERKLLAIRKQTQNPLAELAEKHGLPGLTQFYMPSLLEPDGGLQGPAARDPGRQLLRRPARSADRVGARRWSTSASRPTPSRPGSSRTPTASSPTTARSTPCAATSTG